MVEVVVAHYAMEVFPHILSLGCIPWNLRRLAWVVWGMCFQWMIVAVVDVVVIDILV